MDSEGITRISLGRLGSLTVLRTETSSPTVKIFLFERETGGFGLLRRREAETEAGEEIKGTTSVDGLPMCLLSVRVRRMATSEESKRE